MGREPLVSILSWRYSAPAQFPAACGLLYGDAIVAGHVESEGGGAVGRPDTIIEACWENVLLFKRARRIPHKREEELVCLLSRLTRSNWVAPNGTLSK